MRMLARIGRLARARGGGTHVRADGRRAVAAIVTDAVAPYHRGGKEQWYREIAPRLNRHLDVHIYTMKWWKGPSTVHHDGVPYRAISRYMPLYASERRSIAQAIVFALSCLRLLTVDFDVLVADHMPYLQLFPLKLVALIRRRALVVVWHEVWSRRQWRAYLGSGGLLAWCLERLATKLPDHIIPASAQTAERLAQRGCRAPVTVAAGGVDLDLALRTRPVGETVDLVSVGRLLSHKRFDLLLECVALLRDRGQEVTCRIIGDGPERPSLERRARQLRIESLVEFRAGVGEDELLPLVKAGRVFVFPSEREGFGIAALEAIACGLPVITTWASHNHARHLVARSARGTVCEPTAPALATAVQFVRTRGAAFTNASFEDRWVRDYDWGVLAGDIAAALNAVAPPEAARQPAARTATPAEPPAVPAGTHRAPPVLAAAARTLPPIAGGSSDAPTAEASPLTETIVPERPPAGPPETRTRSLAPWDLALSILGVLAIGALSRVRGVWIAQGAELALLLSVPGFILLRALPVSAEAVRGFPIYVLGASIAVLMGAGLIVDLVGPPLGVSRPLATVPLTVAICAVCAALIPVGLLRGAPSIVGGLGGTARLWRAWPLLLPVLAWIGATRFNNGHGAGFAIAAVAITGVALMLAAWRADRWTRAQTGLLVYGTALALMWGFTLRSRFVYGFDITGEYQTFLQVLHDGRWHAAHHGDPYGAMLSLTIFPATLVAMTGATPLLVLKAIYPCLFAFFPVAVYLLATRVLRWRFAYLAVLFVLVQTYLFQQLPAIARQEIALLFFVCLVFAMFDRRLRRGGRIATCSLFALALVLSHYSTAYVTIAILAAAIGLELARRLIRRDGEKVVIAPFVTALAVMAGAAAIWYQPVTHSAQNLSQFVSDLGDKGISPFPNAGGGILHSYLSGNLTSRVSGARFATLAHNDYAKHRTYVHPLPQASQAAFGLRDASAPRYRYRSAPAASALGAEEVLVAQLTNLFAAIGALVLWWRRRGDPAARGIALLGVGTLLFLLAIRLSGTVSNDYNQERAFLQAMVPLSVCLAWMIQRGSELPRLGRALPVAFAVALGLMFLTTSGLRGPLVGGATATNLASQGEDYDRYYVTPSELAAARWLNGAAPPGEIVSADRYGALRIQGATNRIHAVLPQLTPRTLDIHAWVYADTANFVGHRARGEEDGHFALYVWPDYVGEFWNLVYTNGSSAVYARTH